MYPLLRLQCGAMERIDEDEDSLEYGDFLFLQPNGTKRGLNYPKLQLIWRISPIYNT